MLFAFITTLQIQHITANSPVEAESISWCKKLGVKGFDRVSPKSWDGIRGLGATENIAKGEIMMENTLDKLVTSELITKEPWWKEIYGVQLDASMRVAFWLLQHQDEPLHEYAQFYKMLPTEPIPGIEASNPYFLP